MKTQTCVFQHANVMEIYLVFTTVSDNSELLQYERCIYHLFNRRLFLASALPGSDGTLRAASLLRPLANRYHSTLSHIYTISQLSRMRYDVLLGSLAAKGDTYAELRIGITHSPDAIELFTLGKPTLYQLFISQLVHRYIKHSFDNVRGKSTIRADTTL